MPSSSAGGGEHVGGLSADAEHGADSEATALNHTAASTQASYAAPEELPKPEGGIMDRMLENTPARTVADFLTGYRHTNDDDKATITSENTIGISQLRDAYKNQCGLNIDQNAFMDELERLGVKVKRTATRSNGVNHNKLAWLQCIPDTEAPARS